MAAIFADLRQSASMLYPIKDQPWGENSSIPFILQARTLSTRCPKKILQPFGDSKTLLAFQLQRLKTAFPSAPIIVATTDLAADQPIADIASDNEVSCFRGSEQDVLDRFLECCKHFGFTGGHLVRICTDNPFLQMDLLETLIASLRTAGPDFDYYSYRIGQTPAIRTHFGFFAEIASIGALQKVWSITRDALYHEHVTNYIYDPMTKDPFRIHWIDLPGLEPYLDSVRLTIDTPEDLRRARFVYDRLSRDSLSMEGLSTESLSADCRCGWQEIIGLLDRIPSLKTQMTDTIRSYQK